MARLSPPWKSLCKCAWDFCLFFSQIKKRIASNKFLCTGITQKSFSSARQFCTFIPFRKLILAHKGHCREYNSVTWFSHLIAEGQGQFTEEGVHIGGHPENKFCGMALHWLNSHFACSNLVLWELMLSKQPWNADPLPDATALSSQLVHISTFLKLCPRY